MTYEEFYKEQYPVLLKAEEQLKNLITQFETNENKKKIAYCSSRIKSPESMKQKLLKKGEEPNAENAVSKVNDAVGVRVITSFVDDIYKVADLIEKQQDIHILKIKDYVQQPKKSGYQSLHLIVEVPVTYLDKTTAVRVEIQIRSVAMDYWAELDSQMCYKKDAGQLEAVEKATKQYADVIAGVDKKMLELRKKIQKM